MGIQLSQKCPDSYIHIAVKGTFSLKVAGNLLCTSVYELELRQTFLKPEIREQISKLTMITEFPNCAVICKGSLNCWIKLNSGGSMGLLLAASLRKCLCL